MIRTHAKVLSEVGLLTQLSGERGELSPAEFQILDEAISTQKPPMRLFSKIVDGLREKANELRDNLDSKGKETRNDDASSIDRLSGNINTYKSEDDPEGVNLSRYLTAAKTHLPVLKIVDDTIAAVKFMLFEYPRFKDQAKTESNRAQKLNQDEALRSMLGHPSDIVSKLKIKVDYDGKPFLTLTFLQR
jgi:hypothetical protein